jgi:hypothetical protein
MREEKEFETQSNASSNAQMKAKKNGKYLTSKNS